MTNMTLVGPSPKEQIVVAAERLFALHGIDGVSLRYIGVAAGSNNKSAVHYHFGSKDQLIKAIYLFRLSRLHERRVLLIAERRPDDLRAWVECHVRPLLEQSEQPGSYYAGFVAMLFRYGRRDVFESQPDKFEASTGVFCERLGAFLTHIPEPLRTHRIARAMASVVHAAADRERARAESRPVPSFALEVADLLDGVVGFLSAPVSAASLASAGDLDPASVAWPALV